MKRKIVSVDQYQNNIQSSERLSFEVILPFNSITTPKTTVFTAWHGPTVIGFGSTGTIYVCRSDNDSYPLNFDVYSIAPTEKLDVYEIKTAPKQEYHWASDIPQFIKQEAPKWVIEKTDAVTKGQDKLKQS